MKPRQTAGKLVQEDFELDVSGLEAAKTLFIREKIKSQAQQSVTTEVYQKPAGSK